MSNIYTYSKRKIESMSELRDIHKNQPSRIFDYYKNDVTIREQEPPSGDITSLNDLRWCAFGDSLTDPTQSGAFGKRYDYWLKQKYDGLSVTNLGVGGTGYKQRYNLNPPLDFVTRSSQIPDNLDILTVYGSINDHSVRFGPNSSEAVDANGNPVGMYYDDSDRAGSNYTGYIHEFHRRAKLKNPKKVVMCSLTPYWLPGNSSVPWIANDSLFRSLMAMAHYEGLHFYDFYNDYGFTCNVHTTSIGVFHPDGTATPWSEYGYKNGPPAAFAEFPDDPDLDWYGKSMWPGQMFWCHNSLSETVKKRRKIFASLFVYDARLSAGQDGLTPDAYGHFNVLYNQIYMASRFEDILKYEFNLGPKPAFLVEDLRYLDTRNYTHNQSNLGM